MQPCDAPRFVPPVDAGGWTQLNVGLRSTGSLRDAAWPLFDDLERWLAAAGSEGAVECWFVRKSPALRLRLRGPGLDAHARNQLCRLLNAERELGRVVFWGWSTYEPEVQRLGGPIGLALFHTLMSQNTELWLAWERLSRSGRTRLAPELMALCLYGELLHRSLQASEEAWDVWTALLKIYDEPDVPPPGPRHERVRWLQPRALDPFASPSERTLLRRGYEAADRFARGLAHAHDHCTLVGGRRALLGTIASFYFNLWCLRPQTVAGLCRLAVAELEPRFDFSLATQMQGLQ